MTTPTLSLVTGTINRPPQLSRLIQSVVRETTVPWELIIMDASEKPYTGPVPDHVQIVHESPRLGMVKGYNTAFRMCTGKYVLWLNDDAEVLPGYDTAGVNLLELHPEIGMGAYYYKEGPRFHVNMLYQMIFANFGILPRWVGDKVGWFDEELTMYGSDNSLTFRVLLEGLGVVTVPGPNIIHHSERDEMRISNEHLRPTDGDKLNAKYGPYKKQMQQVYSKFKHLIGPRFLAV
jgi:GT2 family glycosyltransferase